MKPDCCDADLSRRTVLAGAILGVSAAFAGLAGAPGLGAAEPETGHHAHSELSPDQALNRMKEGNRAYLAGGAAEPDTGSGRRLAIAQSQSPMAAIICCSDSRVPPEILFNQGLGELFVIRIAGNTVDDAGAMGSVEYAVAELSVPLVVVLGHERCGAVGAAVAVVERGATFPGIIGQMVQPIIPAVLDARRSGSPDLLDASVRANVRRTVDRLRRRSEPFVLDAIRAGRLRIVGARYDLDQGNVDFFDEGEALQS
ncbi:MAG TPA: carbonic anhydrase [Allosphingosinicella sp.]